jgi:hypothetical protein
MQTRFRNAVRLRRQPDFHIFYAQPCAVILEGSHISVEDLVPRIPANAYRAALVGDQTYWTFTLRECAAAWFGKSPSGHQF